MAASSSYKTYARQPRMLTEEAGFAGGMLWTDNNIDATHLKNIVNFDYDETTTFLKTRDAFVQHPSSNALYTHPSYDKPAEVVRLENSEGALVGVYTISAIKEEYYDGKLLEDTLFKAGQLYVFRNNSIELGDDTQVLLANSFALSLFYKDSDGDWFKVALDSTIDEAAVLWSNTIQIKPVLHDNTLYITNNDSDLVLNAYKLYCFTNSPDDLYSQKEGRVYTLKPADNIAKSIDSIALSECLANGWNGARGKDMFNFVSTESDFCLIEGVLLKDASGNVLIEPKLGVPTTLDIILKGKLSETTLIAVFEQTQEATDDLDAMWKHLGYAEDPGSEDSPIFSFEYTFTKENTTLGFTWYTKRPEDYDEKPIFNFPDSPTSPWVVNYGHEKNASNSRIKTYNVPTAQACCVWNERMVLWDLVDDKHTLFISQVNNFFYYPIPNNVAVFDSDIVNCVPYLGDLLVFTTNRIYKLSVDSAGVFTQTVVQNDMPVSKQDALCLRVIKNMVFFKSGNYFYMVVPKTQSLTGELTIAPIYKNIASLLNNKEQYLYETLSAMYPVYYEENGITVDTTPLDVYVEQDTVHILYNVKTKGRAVEGIIEQSFVWFLNYNTNIRAWTVYLEETTKLSLVPSVLTVARNTEFVRINKANGFIYTASAQPTVNEDASFRCLIDTGYRSLASAFKKRFREVQLKLYSESENVASFYSAFYLDGSARKCYNRLEETTIDEAQKYVTLAPVFDPNAFLLEDTVGLDKYGELVSNKTQSGSDKIELSHWTLDLSHFRKNAVTTLRVPVSGKGYSPRFVLMSDKGMALYVNEINWAYRMLYGR